MATLTWVVTTSTSGLWDLIIAEFRKEQGIVFIQGQDGAAAVKGSLGHKREDGAFDAA